MKDFKDFMGCVAYFLGCVLWLAGIVIAARVSGVPGLAIFFPPYAWYLIVELLMVRWELVT